LLEARIVKEPEENNIIIGDIFLLGKQDTNQNQFLDKKEFVSGRILVKIKEKRNNYNDKVRIKGRIEFPPEFKGFDYQNYLFRQGIFGLIKFPEIKLVEENYKKGFLPLFYKGIISLKQGLRKIIEVHFLTDQAYILKALVLGDKKTIPYHLKEKLNNAGIRHLTAVSGMHMVVISFILAGFLSGIGISRRSIFYFLMIFIFLFTALTGFQISALRASIMIVFFLFAQKIGREYKNSRLVFIIAAFLLFLNPFLFLETGFQLSFLALLGIIYFSLFFKRVFFFLPQNKYLDLRGIASLTFSAYLFTFPIIIYNFGKISLVSLLTNILILPLMPLIMGLSIAFCFFSLISSFSAFPLSLALHFLLSYLLRVAELFSKPYFVFAFDNVSPFFLIIAYSFLGVFLFLIKRKERMEKLNFLNSLP